MKNLLITGGAGYIGSHAILEALKQGYNLKVIDSLITGNKEILSIIENKTGSKINFEQVDIKDKAKIRSAIEEFAPDYVINFAALKSVGDGEKYPK